MLTAPVSHFRRNLLRCAVPLALLFGTSALFAQQAKPPVPVSFSLSTGEGLDVINGKVEPTTYRGRRAIRLVANQNPQGAEESVLAILTGTDFKDGTIEADIAGYPRADAPADDRGFIGIAFRVQEHGARLENVYIRATNGRADDQLRRNHSVQYESRPDYPWFRLRKENPGVYESYTDLEAGAWTKVKIVVSGTKARLYVNGADQPCLIVNDLKLGEAHGPIALWAYQTTEAYFSSVTIH